MGLVQLLLTFKLSDARSYPYNAEWCFSAFTSKSRSSRLSSKTYMTSNVARKYQTMSLVTDKKCMRNVRKMQNGAAMRAFNPHPAQRACTFHLRCPHRLCSEERRGAPRSEPRPRPLPLMRDSTSARCCGVAACVVASPNREFMSSRRTLAVSG